MWSSDDLESIACDACGSTTCRELVVRPDGMRVVECESCGLGYLNPRPRPALISRLYREDYFGKADTSASCGYVDYLDEREELLRLSQRRLEIVQDVIGRLPARCMEIGCATGEFCEVLNRRGIKAIGVDLSDYAIQQARERYPGVDFRQGDIQSLGTDAVFDAVFGFEVIEHVLSPKCFLRSAHQLLVPGGFLVLSTPNLACAREVGSDAWAGFLKSFEHLYFFTPESLTDCASQEGFTMVEWLTGWGDGRLPSARRPHKQPLKKVLAGAGLLTVAGRMRATIRSVLGRRSHGYQIRGRHHNLFMVLQKS